jgi:hypothetical protein
MVGSQARNDLGKSRARPWHFGIPARDAETLAKGEFTPGPDTCPFIAEGVVT